MSGLGIEVALSVSSPAQSSSCPPCNWEGSHGLLDPCFSPLRWVDSGLCIWWLVHITRPLWDCQASLVSSVSLRLGQTGLGTPSGIGNLVQMQNLRKRQAKRGWRPLGGVASLC